MFPTNRLRLRAYKPSDFQPLYDLRNILGNMNWLQCDAHVVPTSEDNFKDGVLKFFLSSLMFCIVEELESGAFLGYTMLFDSAPKNRSAMFSISLHPDFQNKGYGTEVTRFMVDYAFHNLGLHRVSLTVFSGNDGAVAAYTKSGFVEEAITRKAIWINGEWHDEIRMGIIDEEWLASKRETTHSHGNCTLVK